MSFRSLSNFYHPDFVNGSPERKGIIHWLLTINQISNAFRISSERVENIRQNEIGMTNVSAQGVSLPDHITGKSDIV